MSPERWRRIEELYHLALERSPGQRAAFLAEVCGGDAELRRELESLLGHGESPAAQGAIFDRPAWEAAGELWDTGAMDQARDLAGSRISHYEILEKLGEGGMGVVYKARDTHLDRFVALKVLPPERVADPVRKARFAREAKAASALNHPNIVTIHDISSDAGHDFIAMELVRGRALSDVLRDHRPMPPSLATGYAVQLCDGLGAAHRAGIVHRDIKPSNIMLTHDGLVKILDFGLAKSSAREAEAASPHGRSAEPLSLAGTVMGTVPYMSPEQAVGDAVGPCSDVFSVGIVLYEMLSGRRPFQGPSNIEVIHALLSADPAPLSSVAPDVPEPLSQIVHKCLRKSPDARYGDAAEVARQLRALHRKSFLRSISELTTATMGADGRMLSHSGRRRILFGAIAILVLIIALLGGYQWWPAAKQAANPLLTAATASARAEALQRAQAYLQRYDRKDNVNSAITLLEATLQRAGPSAAVYATLAEAFVRKYNESTDKQWLPKAVESGRQAVGITYDLAAGHTALGMALAASGEKTEAVAEFNRAIDLNPLSGPAHVGLAKLSSGKQAEQLFQKAVGLSPDSWIPLNELAAFYYSDARYDESIATWRKALGLAEDNVRLMANLGAGLHKMGRYEEAAVAFQDALRLDESNALTWANLATARYFQGRYLDAARAAEKAVERAPGRYKYWGNLGDTYRWAEGRKPLAGKTYEKAIELVREDLKLNPNDAGLRSALAAYRAKSGDTHGALAELAQLGELRDKDPLFKAAMVYELAGDRDKALAALERAVRAGYSMHEVVNEPELAALRSDPRYARIAAVAIQRKKE